MQITEMLLTPNKYSRPQIPLKKVTKIAVHYIGNAGTSAKANRNYFESLRITREREASAHYIIGLDGEIIRCIPENEWSYATNDANGYSISIENCHPAKDGKFTAATRKSLTELCADICKRYKLDPITDIIRHFDVTGKACPLYWVNHPDDFRLFKLEVAAYIAYGSTAQPKLETINLQVNGKVIKADAMIYNDETFIKLRGLENAGFAVGYDKDTKLRTLDNKITVLPIERDGEIQGVESLKLHDYNFVSIRPLAAMCGYGVDYNTETKGVALVAKE